MTTTLRIDDSLKQRCDLVLNDIGLNLSCAITIFLKELARRRAMPFTLRATGSGEYASLETSPKTRISLWDKVAAKRLLQGSSYEESIKEGVKAFEAIRRECMENNEHEWTLDEINAEINATREDRMARERAAV